MFPKKTMDYNKCEVARFAKVVGKEIMYLGFFVPRRNPGYDSSLYPPVYTGEPAITTDEWMGGANKDPIVKEINTIENKWVSEPMKLGQELEFEIEAIDAEKVAEIQEMAIDITKGEINSIDTYKLKVETIANGCKMFKNKELGIPVVAQQVKNLT